MSASGAVDPSRMPVTVISGYLGAGKTTLVNHLLATATEPCAVLVNDFGQVNIDVDLIASHQGDTIELTNGCICCSIVDGFASALDSITSRQPRPARLVIEASGVADPAQVAAYAHGPGLMLDAVIVLVDAETIRDSIDDKYVGQTVGQQLDRGDVIVANKADLVDGGELADIVQWLTARCPEAYVLTAADAQVADEVLFGRSARSVPAGSAAEPRAVASHSFTTSTLGYQAPLTRAQVDQIMEQMAPSVVRAKGLVWLQDDLEQPWVLQRVGRRWTLRRAGRGWGAEPGTTIVVIEVHTAER